jgi:hypothetical protein
MDIRFDKKVFQGSPIVVRDSEMIVLWIAKSTWEKGWQNHKLIHPFQPTKSTRKQQYRSSTYLDLIPFLSIRNNTV